MFVSLFITNTSNTDPGCTVALYVHTGYLIVILQSSGYSNFQRPRTGLSTRKVGNERQEVNSSMTPHHFFQNYGEHARFYHWFVNTRQHLRATCTLLRYNIFNLSPPFHVRSSHGRASYDTLTGVIYLTGFAPDVKMNTGCRHTSNRLHAQSCSISKLQRGCQGPALRCHDGVVCGPIKTR